MSAHDVTFPAMGSQVRLVIGEPGPGLPSAQDAASRAREFVESFDGRLSRFRSGSELQALNADRREQVPASQLLRCAVAAGLWAAESSGGLVDPTLVSSLEAAGYRDSRAGVAPAPLAEALAAAPPRRAARPSQTSRWREIGVDDATGVVRRPPGLRFDTGGTGKGLCADVVAYMLSGYSNFVVDCGGDMRVRSPEGGDRPYEIEIEHPLTGDCAARVPVSSGAIATSGLNSRIWTRANGSGFAHHLIDPSTGEPAWTGVISATALAPTALAAETLAKVAVLLGPAGARRVLRPGGGVIVLDDGTAELVGAVLRPPLLRVRVPARGEVAA